MGAALSPGSSAAVRDFSHESGLEDSCLGPEGWKLLLDRFPHPSWCCLTQISAARKPSSCQWFILSLASHSQGLGQPLVGMAVPEERGLPGGAAAHRVQQWVRAFPRGTYDTFQFYSSNARQHKLLGTIKDQQKALSHLSGYVKK